MTEVDVAVIGAGAAGAGAVAGLAALPASVLVLEAMPRVGGRAHTVEAAGLPLDLGCGWLHSADRNPWVAIAERDGLAVDRRTPAWGTQYRDLGTRPGDAAAARAAVRDLNRRLAADPPATDRAADALDPAGPWVTFLQARSGFHSGDTLDRISAADLVAYDTASTDSNWRVREGYGTLVARNLPGRARLSLTMPVRAVELAGGRVHLATPAGTVRARAVVVTLATDVLAGEGVAWPAALAPWREAARHLPLGRNEKLFLQIVDEGPFEPETHAIGDYHDPMTNAYSIRPFGWPVIECYLGGPGARAAAADPAGAFARAVDQLVRLFGSAVRRHLRPLVGSDWGSTATVGGAYSYALPGHAPAREQLARPFEDRIFFAGEATHATAFSTAHGAYETGLRAARDCAAALHRARLAGR